MGLTISLDPTSYQENLVSISYGRKCLIGLIKDKFKLHPHLLRVALHLPLAVPRLRHLPQRDWVPLLRAFEQFLPSRDDYRSYHWFSHQLLPLVMLCSYQTLKVVLSKFLPLVVS